MFDNEADFVHYISERLKKSGFDVQRLETHSTLNGVPDMYIQGKGGFDTWIEFKNVKKKLGNSEFVKPEWRPAQRAWALRYHVAHKSYCLSGTPSQQYMVEKTSWIFIAYTDKIVLARTSFLNINDATINLHQPDVWTLTYKEFECVKLDKFLRIHTEVILPVRFSDVALSDFIRTAYKEYCKRFNTVEGDMGDLYELNYEMDTLDLPPEVTSLTQSDVSLDYIRFDTIQRISSKLARIAIANMPLKAATSLVG